MKSNNRKKRKIFVLFFIMALTVVTFIFETYAWFIGTGTVTVSSFDVSVTSTDGLQLSLKGTNFSNSITINTENINGYNGSTNVFPSTGLTPFSSIGLMNQGTSRLEFFEKTSLSATTGGYRISANKLDYTSSAEQSDGYVAFDLFIKNGNGSSYAGTNVNFDADEDIYLTSATVTGLYSGGAANGIENSVRVGFFEIGRAKINQQATIYESLKCNSQTNEQTGTVALCSNNTDLDNNRGKSWNIWEPNSKKHTNEVISFYTNSCKTPTNTACTALTANQDFKTYAINSGIMASDGVEIYDGLNSKTSSKLKEMSYYRDADITDNTNNKKSLIRVAGNSVTKVRVYIWLEGQDVDNNDKALDKATGVRVNFGFTKDRYNIGSST